MRVFGWLYRDYAKSGEYRSHTAIRRRDVGMSSNVYIERGNTSTLNQNLLPIVISAVGVLDGTDCHGINVFDDGSIILQLFLHINLQGVRHHHLVHWRPKFQLQVLKIIQIPNSYPTPTLILLEYAVPIPLSIASSNLIPVQPRLIQPLSISCDDSC